MLLKGKSKPVNFSFSSLLLDPGHLTPYMCMKSINACVCIYIYDYTRSSLCVRGCECNLKTHI